MRIHMISAACVTALVLATPAFAAGVQKETETINKTVSLPANGTVRLKNFSGSVTITGGSGREIVIKAERHATRDRLDHIKMTVDTSGSTVTINANDRDSSWRDDHDNVVETRFDIQVPASAKLDLDVFSSDVDVRGVSGTTRVNTFSGRVTLDATAAGESPELDVKTFSGNIEARLADRARGSVQFDTFSGDFNSDFLVSIHSTRRRSRNVDANLPGGAGHTLSFHTFSGDVRILK